MRRASAASPSGTKDNGSFIVAGATPSSTAARTRSPWRRMYSSATRVPYEPPHRLTRS
jgi:hypothetical protein